MSGLQSVVNHLRFARHWLAKAEDEFQRSHSAEGELTLSLVEAEVRKAWAESQRTFEKSPVPAAPPVRRLPGRALLAGAAVMALAVGGYGASRLRPAVAETRIQTAGLAGHAVQALPPTTAAPVGASIASRPSRAGDQSDKAAAVPGRPAGQVARLPGKVNKVPTLPWVRGVSAPSPGEVVIEPQTPASTATEVNAPAQENPTPARKAEAEPAAPPAEKPAAERPAERKSEAPRPAEPAAATVPAAEKHPPAAATAPEGGGTPLPLDVVELVRIAERSLTGRP